MTTTSTTTTSSATTATDTAAVACDLPPERPLHTTELLQRLDAPIRRAIDHVLTHGWPSRTLPPNWSTPAHFNFVKPSEEEFSRVVNMHTKRVWLPVGTWRDPWDLARSIAYNARVRGLSRWCALAAVEVVLGAYLDHEAMWSAVRGGRHLAEQHASQAIDIEVTHASVKRAQHAGASWTLRFYARPITPTAAMPTETSYACAVLDEHGAPTTELLALLDTFGADGGPVLHLDREHVLALHKYRRLEGRRARAITQDDMRVTTHLLRLDGYS